MFSLVDLGGVLLVAVFVKISGSEAGYFLPGLVSGAITVVLCVLSVAINRHLIA